MPYKPDFLDEIVRLEIEGKMLQALKYERELLITLCECALNSTELLRELQSFDLLVYDSPPAAMCAPLVGELLDIPRVEMCLLAPNSLLALNHMIPMPISYVPQLLLGLTDKMTFLERVINLVGYLGGKLIVDLVIGSTMNALKVKYNIKPERSWQKAVGDAELVIITADFALEYPQPLLPGMTEVWLNFSCTCGSFQLSVQSNVVLALVLLYHAL